MSFSLPLLSAAPTPPCWQPVRAVQGDDHYSGMLRALCYVEDPSKTVVVSTAPTVRVTVPEALGLPRDAPRQSWEGEVFAALRRLGFPVVFDTNFAADLTIMEEGTELLHRCRSHICVLAMHVECGHFHQDRYGGGESARGGKEQC